MLFVVPERDRLYSPQMKHRWCSCSVRRVGSFVAKALPVWDSGCESSLTHHIARVTRSVVDKIGNKSASVGSIDDHKTTSATPNLPPAIDRSFVPFSSSTGAEPNQRIAACPACCAACHLASPYLLRPQVSNPRPAPRQPRRCPAYHTFGSSYSSRPRCHLSYGRSGLPSRSAGRTNAIHVQLAAHRSSMHAPEPCQYSFI